MDKKFIDYFENKVEKTIKSYALLDKKDKVLVACSGGKDSTTALYLLNKLGYRVEAVTVDLLIGNYSKENIENLKLFCKQLKVKLHILSFKDEFGYSLCYIKDVLRSKGSKLKSCSVCGVLRRYLLNKEVRKLKAAKIATGHNLDDEAQAVLMNFLRNNLELSSRQGPMTGVIKDEMFVPRIKPLYLCLEKEVTEYSQLMGFPVLYQKCPCSYDVYRSSVRKLLNEYELKHPGTKESIIKSFLEILPKLKKKYRKGKLNYCKKCREPSKKDVCMACQIIDKLK